MSGFCFLSPSVLFFPSSFTTAKTHICVFSFENMCFCLFPVCLAHIESYRQYSQMLKSWRHSIFEAFTWGFESMEVVAMQAKRRSHRQTSGEAGGETSNESKAAVADKTPITADKRGDKKKEGRKERRTGARAYT